MAIEWKATCGTASASIKCKRPNWESVREAYNKINTANPNDKNLQEIFKQAIIDKGKWYGFSQKAAEQTAKEVIEQIINNNYDDSIWQRYALVGGTPLSEYISHKNFFDKSPNYADYSNTCALQVSYALNYGGMPLHTEIKVKEYNSMYGKDKEYLYITRVINTINFLHSKSVWGNADEPYNPKSMQTKQENIDFYNNEFSKFDKSGVVAMIINGWDNANGHITLWNGKKKQFIDNTNYLLDKRDWVVIEKLYFWELI